MAEAHRDAVAQLLDFLIIFSTYPECLFSGMLRWLLFSALPAGFVSYLLVRVLSDHGSPWDVLLLAAGAAGFLGLGIWVFGRGLVRYASASRFGVWG